MDVLYLATIATRYFESGSHSLPLAFYTRGASFSRWSSRLRPRIDDNCYCCNESVVYTSAIDHTHYIYSKSAPRFSSFSLVRHCLVFPDPLSCTMIIYQSLVCHRLPFLIFGYLKQLVFFLLRSKPIRELLFALKHSSNSLYF